MTDHAYSAVLAAVTGAETPDPDQVVGALLAALVPGIDGARWASITRPRNRAGFVTAAASDQVARLVDDVQYELGDGPCLRAVGGVLVTADAQRLYAEWPELARRTHERTPVRSVLSLPLSDGALPGSLNVYSDCADGLPASASSSAACVAIVCGLALAALQQRIRADHLSAALQTNRRISAAVGIVMAASRCTYEQAFETLRRASQRTQQKLSEVADEVLFTGAVPGPVDGVRAMGT